MLHDIGSAYEKMCCVIGCTPFARRVRCNNVRNMASSPKRPRRKAVPKRQASADEIIRLTCSRRVPCRQASDCDADGAADGGAVRYHQIATPAVRLSPSYTYYALLFQVVIRSLCGLRDNPEQRRRTERPLTSRSRGTTAGTGADAAIALGETPSVFASLQDYSVRAFAAKMAAGF